MISIGITTQDDRRYGLVSTFARRVYASKLNAETPANPDLFVYGSECGDVIGCMGLYKAATRDTLLIETYRSRLFEEISGLSPVERHLCAEIGTWAIPLDRARCGMRLSIALTAELIMHAHRTGIRYLGFTTTPTVRVITKALGLELIHAGDPDLSTKDEVFLRNWREFFADNRSCFGFHIKAIGGCIRAIEKFAQREEMAS